MKRAQPTQATLPVHDYEQARQRAVSWLGDRYLLAEPLPRRKEALQGYFAETRRWHGAMAAGLGRRTH